MRGQPGKDIAGNETPAPHAGNGKTQSWRWENIDWGRRSGDGRAAAKTAPGSPTPELMVLH